MLLIDKGGIDLDLGDEEIDQLFTEALFKALEFSGNAGNVIILPPDITRFYSRSGFLTDIAFRELSSHKHGARLGAVMPALGTHMAMTDAERRRMFPNTPAEKFRVHDWRNDIATLGVIEETWLEKATDGKVKFDWPVQVNKLLLDGGFSMILSIGQVVPHEVVGMANHAKNIFIGVSGREAIDKSHFAGAVYGMERMMGRIETPVRALLDEGIRRYGEKIPPVFYVLTVIGSRANGSLAMRGLFAGFGRECFEKAAALSRQVNVNLLDEPIKKAVVYLESEEFRTTWLGNKAVYRTRMAMADDGELLILAPGLERFGEDLEIDKLIRKYGYRPGRQILELAEREKDLAASLSVAAHLIHGSSEQRFTVHYAPGTKVSRNEIESVGYEWANLNDSMTRYEINKLKTGWNTMPDGERIFFVPNPALGLWAEKKRFDSD